MAQGVYRFGEFELDPARFQLTCDGEPVRVEPRAFDLLRLLVTHHDRVVTKQEILEHVWQTEYVSDAALTTALRTVRRAVGDTGADQRVIRTAHGRGYQVVAPVEIVGAAADDAVAGLIVPVAPSPEAPAASPAAREAERPAVRPSAELQTIRYCSAADGARIAYATVGEGPVLMKAANWITHLDLEWDSPVWSHWVRGLARGRTLVRYDERGCGMSDWSVPGFSFEDWVTDLETVVAATGLERFPLLGVSQGAAVAIDYAARHPEKVSSLILAGGYVLGRMKRARDDAERAAAALDIDLARVGWGREDPTFMRVFASQFLPRGSQREWDEFTAFQRRTTSDENAVRFLEEFALIDVREQAARVSCPTLILHSRDDGRVPIDQARELASLIPRSRLVLLDSASHLIGEAEPAWPEFLAHIDEFLSDPSHS
ncbi:alpha/beta fold hydrolase [Demequina mangrovi]|uniref:Lysine decarboxylase transcriptional regulator, CadC n=1 Tax=Demequina mangrovi TaxID=1043493 RepID=A0A1H7AIF2_9MICO|nr:alpha/beta fold hydrolase [Demequina mangrovi]SEJ64354.1 lysine decarboxylase transcriptional regulator, CadC [Demequina mangrovi]